MSDDFADVPGDAPDWDYTKEEPESSKVPFGVPTEVGEDEGLVSAFSTGRSTEEIEKDTYRYLDVGIHTVEIKEVLWADNGSSMTTKSYVKLADGRVVPKSMDCRKLKVVFNAIGDSNLTCQDTFILPPAPSQLDAYERGFSDEATAAKKSPEQGGFHAKKLQQFIHRMGFVLGPKGEIPPEAMKFKNWVKYPGTNIHRRIRLELILAPQGADRPDPRNPGKMYTPPRYKNVKMFSYMPVDIPENVQKAIAQASSPVTEPVAEAPKPEVAPVKNGGSHGRKKVNA